MVQEKRTPRLREQAGRVSDVEVWVAFGQKVMVIPKPKDTL